MSREHDIVIVQRYRAGESAIEIAKSLGVVKRTVYNALQRAGVDVRRKLNFATDDQVDEIVRRYVAGGSADVIAKDIGIDRVTVYNFLRRRGIAKRLEMTHLDDDQRLDVVAACKEGKIIEAVAEQFDVGRSTVDKILRANKITLQIGRRRDKDIDDSALDIVTPESAYWIGFLFSDGCIHQDKYGAPVLAVGLAEKDRGHLEKMRRFFKSTHCISRSGRTETSFGGPFVHWRARSIKLCTAMREFGIIKKKERVPVPALSSMPAFWRGCIDGDGSIGTSVQGRNIYPFIRLSGQVPLLEQFQKFIVSCGLARLNIVLAGERTGSVFEIETSGKTADRLIKILYKNVTDEVVLSRKNERAQVIILGDLKRFPAYTEGPGRFDINPNDPVDHLDEIENVYAELKNIPFPFPIELEPDAVRREVGRLQHSKTRLDEDSTIRPWSPLGIRVCAPFFPNRYAARWKSTINAIDGWNDERVMRRAIDFQIRRGDPVVPHRVLRAVTLVCRTPTIFRPSVARFVYQNFCPSGGVVWDPCSGFGGRLLGAHVAGVRYIGTDVDPATVDGNRRLAKAIGSNAIIRECRAEIFEPPTVDLVFTSPPYFNREQYSDNNDQSYRRYGSLDQWVSGFIRPVIERAFQALRSNGHLVLNVANLNERGTVIPIVQRTIETACVAGFVQAATLQMPLAAINRKAPAEPLLVFKKQT